MTRIQPPRTVHVPQNAETGVTFVAAPGANLRYAYFRSSDSVASQIEGQDYLAFKYGERRLTFVVSDGVGSSFSGNIAASILGEAMLDWLWSLDADHLTSASALSETAKSFLLKLQPKAERQVSRYAIPDHLPALVRQALEAQRDYGSETVFVAGRLDHPGADSAGGRLLLVWMGDTQVRLYDDAGRQIELRATFDASDRWSSVQGVRGTVHAWVTDAERVARLLVFSDGISGYADQLTAFSDLELEEAAQAQFRTATSDDIALLDIVRHTPAYRGLTDTTQPVDATLGAPDLMPVQKANRDDIYQVAWDWNGGRARFELQEAASPAFNDARTEEVGGATAWTTPAPRSPGRYYYRVRALVGRKAMAGPWSAPQTVRVAYPPPPAPSIQPVGPTPVEGAYTVTWSEAANAQEYVLEEATREDFSDATPVYRGRGADWHAGGPRQPMRYYYRVQAVNDGGASPWSAPQVVAVVVPPPPVPTLAHLRDVPPGSPFALSWSDVAQATYYEVQEIDTTSGDERILRAEGTQLAMDVLPAGRYVYSVRACHEHACSEWSAPQSVEVLPDPPDLAPELTVEGPDASHRLSLEWTAVERAVRYVLEESEKDDFRRPQPMSIGDRPQHSLLRREPGFYYYRVRAENVSGFGPWSEPVVVHILPGTPAWVEANLPDEKGQRVEVTWEPVAGQVVYVLELLWGEPDPVTDERPECKVVYQGREPAYALGISEKVREFAFRVRATHPDGGGDWQYSEAVARPSPPATPRVEPPLVQKNGDVLVRWDPVDEATHYEVEYARDEGFSGAKRHTTDRIRFIFQPSASRRIWFRVRACNEHGSSDPSPPAQIVVGDIAAPRMLPVEPSQHKVAWTEVPGATHYEIQEAGDPAFQTVERHVVDAPAKEWTVKRHQPGRTYLRVQAIGPDGRASEWSEVAVV